MPRKKAEINPKSGKRVKQLLIGHKINGKKATQEWLAEQLNISTVYLSDIVRGIKRLPPDLAYKIVELFPETQIEWLLGLDDIQTKEEKQLQKWEQEGKVTHSMVSLIAASFRQQGYEMKMCTPANVPEGYKFHNNDGYYLFSKEKDPIVISVDDYFKMESSVLEYTEFLTSRFLKREDKK